MINKYLAKFCAVLMAVTTITGKGEVEVVATKKD